MVMVLSYHYFGVSLYYKRCLLNKQLLQLCISIIFLLHAPHYSCTLTNTEPHKPNDLSQYMPTMPCSFRSFHTRSYDRQRSILSQSNDVIVIMAFIRLFPRSIPYESNVFGILRTCVWLSLVAFGWK